MRTEETITQSWERELYELGEFFESFALPAGPVRLNAWTLITNPALFVASHIAIVRGNKRNHTFEPHLQRLLELKSVLSHRGTRNQKTYLNSEEQLQLSSKRSEVTVV